MPDWTFVFAPIVWLLNAVLNIYMGLVGSPGLAILLLSTTSSLVLWPLQRIGVRAEQRLAAKTKLVQGEVAAARQSGLRGEALFEETERIYRRHDYHPIHAVMGAASFFGMLPVLIASILLFQDAPALKGRSFLFVNDLAAPDGALGPGMNLLPPIMFAVTFVDAWLRHPNDRRSQFRFLSVSVVLLALVYSLPSGLVLYWIGNNVTVFALARIVPTRPLPASPTPPAR